MSGKLTIHARGGVFVKKVVVPRGEPDNFLSNEELLAKFTSLSEPSLGPQRTAKLADAILHLDGLDRAAMLFDYGVSRA
jgi:2-methylcitrate dehydratase PrpD